MMTSHTAALNFLGRVQSGVSRLQSSVHQQLSHQFEIVSTAVSNANGSANAGFKPSGDVVVSSSGDTLRSLFVCRAPSEPSATRRASESAECTRSESSNLLLTAFDGVSLHIAGFLDAQELYQVQLVNRSWRQFVLENREQLFGALVKNSFYTVIPAPSAFKSYVLSLRHLLMSELLHAKDVQPTHAALEKYCSITEPVDHGFIAMFCDIIEFTDPRVARFVALKRHYALNVVLAATPNHVNTFRKRSDYTRPIAFVPVRNPNWPEFDLPQIEFPGFLGYAFEFVRMAPGYESLKETVAKSILRDLMIFDTSEHAAAYGASISRQPFVAVLDESLANPNLHMTFSSPLRRKMSHLPILERIQSLEERLRAIDAFVINSIV